MPSNYGFYFVFGKAINFNMLKKKIKEKLFIK